MDAKTVKTLEFDKILDGIAAYAASDPAREEIRNIYPLDSLEDINERLAEIAEADKILFELSLSPSFAFDDITAILTRGGVMSVLTMGELLKVALMLRVARNLQNTIIKAPDPSLTRVKAIANVIYTDKALEEDIDKAIISDSEMSDNASPELRAIRAKIKRAGEQIKTKLNSYITSASFSKYLQDTIVTIRDDRYVIPVKQECKSAISGIVHDQSASGQTVYIEPMPVVELNNTLKTYIIEEEREIERILKNFTMRVSVNVEQLSLGFETIARLDVIFSKAKYAYLHKCVMPVMNKNGHINIVKGRHPLIKAEKVVPTDIRLGDNFDMLFITGPNTGGKTVSLKLVGLMEIMAMSGLFVPAYSAELSLFDEVFCDIGDEQSIEQNLSTFSSHIANIVRIVDRISPNSLILLDELGAGTDPTEGAALAVSISTFIKNSGAKAVITTHYNELKEYAVVTNRVENASMDFDPVTYNPTYKLIIGTPGASNAILIAKKLGLKEEIIESAQAGIKDGKIEFENVLNSLEMARRQAAANEEKTAELLKTAEETNKNAERERDRLYAQREKLNENVRKETKRLVAEAMEEANDIVDTLKSLLDTPTEENLFKARTLKKSLNRFVVMEDNEFEGFGEEADGEIREGDKVLVKPLKVEGVVESVNFTKNTASVKLGRLTSNFKLDDLLKLKSSDNEQKERKKVPVASGRELRNDAFSPELNVIGKTVMEGLREVDDFIDKALLSGVNEVRVIHGHGSGKLREGVQTHLRRLSSVLDIRDGLQNEGGRGATIVTLKRN